MAEEKDNPPQLEITEENTSTGKRDVVHSETVSIDEALAKAIELHQQGRYLEAKGIYQAILKTDATHAGALHFLGVLLFQLSHHDDAIELVELALKYQPQYADARNNLGNIYQALNNYDKAESAYSMVLDLQPDNADTLNNLAAVLKAQGKFEEAVVHYHRVLELSPDNAIFHYNLGNAYVSASQWQNALESYTKATELKSDYGLAYRELGSVWRALGNQEESLAAFTKAAQIDESHAEVHCQHGVALQSSGLLEDAVMAYLRALEFDHTLIQTYPNLIVALNSLGRLDEAKDYVNRWRELEPDSVTAAHMHSSITGEDVPTRATDTYVTRLFDDFSEKFDQKLDSLEYRAPQLLLDHCLESGIVSAKKQLSVIDAGCGTGLCGPLFREYAKVLIGVDLSAGMLNQAQQRNIYDDLRKEELTSYLQQLTEQHDLIISADTLVYFGELEQVTAASRSSLHNKGWLVFSVEKLDPSESDKPHRLNLNGRYSHAETYLKSVLVNNGFSHSRIHDAILRQELGKPVHGFVVLARKDSVPG